MFTTANNKYLLFPTELYFKNIDHALNALRNAIREAVHLDRTLVVGTFSVGGDRNLNCMVEITSYDRFVNLDKTEICSIEGGSMKQIEKPFHYINAPDFNLNNYADNRILTVDNGDAITEQQNLRYEIIIRKATDDGYADNYSDILVRFCASAEVDRLTDTVLKVMGTNLEYVKRRSAIHHGTDFSANQDLYQAQNPVHPAYYACLYIPQDICSTPEQLYSSSPHQIIKILNRTRMGRRAVVYVISDIEDPDYFNFLNKHYTPYRYHDIPQLKALGVDENGVTVNKAIFHSVEKNILQYAHIKMIPFKNLSGLPVIYSNSSYKVPRRYKLLARCKSLHRIFAAVNLKLS